MAILERVRDDPSAYDLLQRRKVCAKPPSRVSNDAEVFVRDQ